MDTLKIIVQNVSGALLIIGIVALLMVIICGAGLWLMSRMERRNFRLKMLSLHDDLWDGSVQSEIYCWLQIRNQLMEENAPKMKLEVVNELMDECRKRHGEHRDIMLKTGRVIRTQKPRRV